MPSIRAHQWTRPRRIWGSKPMIFQPMPHQRRLVGALPERKILRHGFIGVITISWHFISITAASHLSWNSFWMMLILSELVHHMGITWYHYFSHHKLLNDIISDSHFRPHHFPSHGSVPSGKPYSTSLHTTSFRLRQRVKLLRNWWQMNHLRSFKTWHDMTLCIQHPCQVWIAVK